MRIGSVIQIEHVITVILQVIAILRHPLLRCRSYGHRHRSLQDVLQAPQHNRQVSANIKLLAPHDDPLVCNSYEDVTETICRYAID